MQTAMAMSPEEKQQFFELQRDVRAIKDDLEDPRDGLNAYRTKSDLIDKKVNSILTLVRGIAIGLAIGGFLFGVIKFPDLIKFFTK